MFIGSAETGGEGGRAHGTGLIAAVSVLAEPGCSELEFDRNAGLSAEHQVECSELNLDLIVVGLALLELRIAIGSCPFLPAEQMQ